MKTIAPPEKREHLYGMQSSPKSRMIIDIIAWLFIVLWMYAAVSKLLDFQTFRVKLGQSPLLTPFAGYIAWFVPGIEILLALMLTAGRSRLSGLYGSFALMVMFTGYIVAITRFSDYVPCSCGGILENMSWDQHLIFNIVFVLFALAGILLEEKDILLQQIRETRKPAKE